MALADAKRTELAGVLPQSFEPMARKSVMELTVKDEDFCDESNEEMAWCLCGWQHR